MAYGIKYNIPFRSATGTDYVTRLLLKDYTGAATVLEGGPAPFILNYQSGDDEIINAIRASEATIQFYNDGNTPLSEFYSDNDNDWKIEFYSGAALLWAGFIVQDSCRESFIDPPYLVQLRATDNIGLLKEIPFGEGYANAGFTDQAINKLSLFVFIQVALKNTGIALPLHIYSNVYENSEADRVDNIVSDMFQQTRLFSGMFLNNSGEWENIYDIIETILRPLNATLLQAAGKWVVIRQAELKQFANDIQGTAYDINFSNPSPAFLSPDILISFNGNNEFIHADATRSILRPFKSVKEKFNYQQPKELIANLNLQQKGPLLREYADPEGNTVREYTLPGWNNVYNETPPPPELFLRIVLQPIAGTVDKVEIDRYAVIKGGNYKAVSLQSSAFRISKSDRVNISFQFRDNESHTGPDEFQFLFVAEDGTDAYLISSEEPGLFIDGKWYINGNYNFEWPAEQDLNEWVSFSVQSWGCPIDGNFFILMPQVSNGGETHYKDFKIEYKPYINDTARITGHEHKRELTQNKNVYDREISIDDSPKPAIQGSLFTSLQTAGQYITLTKNWHRGAINETRRLSEITTGERQQIQSRPRALLDCSILFKDSISPLNVFQVDSLPGLNFIVGVAEFNYMEQLLRATLWEIYATGEAENTGAYTFNYTYEIN